MSVAGVPGRAGARRRSTTPVPRHRVLAVLVLAVSLSPLGSNTAAALERPAEAIASPTADPIAPDARVALIGDSIFRFADDYLLGGVPGDVRMWADGGRRVDNALVELPEQVAWDPDQVVLELGGNDAMQAIYTWDLATTWSSIDTYLSSFPGADCIHVVLMPEDTKVETFDRNSTLINDYWRQRGSLDPRVRFIEWDVTQARQLALGGPALTIDTIHPSIEGALALASLVTSSIEQCVNPGSVEVVPFRDTNGNGTHEPTEPVVDVGPTWLRPDTTAPPMTESVYGPLSGSSPTFAGVAPGDYVVSVQMGSLSPLLEPLRGTWSIGTRVEAGTVTRVELPLARVERSISGRVILDADHDGLTAGDELGIAGVPVQLLADTDANGDYETVVDSTASGADGSYELQRPSTGSYLVQATTPQLYGQLAETTQNAIVVKASSSGALRGIDLGFNLRPITVSAALYLDADRSGSQDADEPNYPRVAFLLFEVVDDGKGGMVASALLDIGLIHDGTVELTDRVPRGSMLALLTIPVDDNLNLVAGIEAMDLPGGLVDSTPGAHTDLSVGFATVVAQ